MAPAHSTISEQLFFGSRKCILATSLADPNNVDAAAIKRRKLEQATIRQRRQPSVETIANDEDTSATNNQHPRKASNTIEAADGSDDNIGGVSSEGGRTGSSVGDVSMPGLMGAEEEEGEDDEDAELREWRLFLNSQVLTHNLGQLRTSAR